MRVLSGVTTNKIYFVAVDATDLKTRLTGLSGFTVYRSRNGAAAVAMTTPTVAELDSVNAPGVYTLLLDEDMTLDAGSDEQEMLFHVTCTSMAAVDRTIDLSRAKATAGETITVSGGDVTADIGVTFPDNFAALDISSGGAVTIGSITDKSGYSLSTAGNTAIAKAVLTEPIDNSEAQATSNCLTRMIAAFTNKSGLVNGLLTVFKANNADALFTQTVTQANINPITAKNRAS
jgi:hypothetical protein